MANETDTAAPAAAAAPAGAPAVAAGASSRYFAWLYTPPAERGVPAGLLAIESEVAASLRPGIDHAVAHARLEWWRIECERARAGRPVHPLTRSVHEACREAQRAALDLCGFVDAAVWDLAAATFESRAELTNYCERWARAMTRTWAECALDGAPRERAAGFGIALGIAVREIELLADLQREAVSGRLRIPLDELDRLAVPPEALAKTPWPLPLCEWLRERHRQLRAALATAAAGLDRHQQPRARGLLVWAALAARQSRQAEAALPLPGDAGRFGALGAAWLAWRSARAAQRERFTLQESTI